MMVRENKSTPLVIEVNCKQINQLKNRHNFFDSRNICT